MNSDQKTVSIITLAALIIFIYIKVASNDTSQSQNVITEQADTLRPIIKTTSIDSIFPIIFEAAYHEGTNVVQGNIEYDFSTDKLGMLKIESGKIIACDPIGMYNAIAFAQIFPIGTFPVELAIAKTSNDERVAFSRIKFSDLPVSKWEFALLPGEQPLPIGGSNFYCFGVDAGQGIYIDEKTNEIFNEKGESEWNYVFGNLPEQNNYESYMYRFDSYNMAIFNTGYGDGCYATYIGYDSVGNVCRLLADFALVEWW